MDYSHKRRLVLGFFLLVLVLLYIFQNVSMLIRTIGAIVSLLLFYFVDSSFKFEFKLRHYIYVLLMIIAAFLLSPLYFLSTIYDKIQHFFMPLLGSIIVFFSVDRFKIDFKWKLFITFTTLMALIVFLEIGEYLFDILFDLKLQGVYLRDITGLERLNLIQSRIDDTMIDMILGVLGSATFALFKTMGFFYKKKFKKSKKH